MKFVVVASDDMAFFERNLNEKAKEIEAKREKGRRGKIYNVQFQVAAVTEECGHSQYAYNALIEWGWGPA